MLFIDWISPPDHKNFNRSFFAALRLSDSQCHVFSPALAIAEVECHVHASSPSRWRQALAVLKLLLKHRTEDILLLTYDPLFLPIASVLKRSLIVFEHNTTPEEGMSKRLIWQKLLFGRVHRLAQFQAQVVRLKRMGSRVTYLGSPLAPVEPDVRSAAPSSGSPAVFLAPSYRAALGQLDRFTHCFETATIVVKREAAEACKDGISDRLRIKPVDWIEVEPDGRPVDGVIITVQSRIRGTGWFNDAIAHRIPVITTNANASQLFRETFPDYPFVDMLDVRDADHFNCLLTKIKSFDSAAYVERHNEALRKRFDALCCKQDVSLGSG